MTKKRGHPTVTQDLAREVYLGLQGARSLKALNAALRKRHGDGAPSFRTLESWCRKGKWVAAAKEYDVRLAKSVAEEIHKQAVAGTVVHVVKLRELSIKLIEKALSALPKVPVEELSQLEASVRVASAALDKLQAPKSAFRSTSSSCSAFPFWCPIVPHPRAHERRLCGL